MKRHDADVECRYIVRLCLFRPLNPIDLYVSKIIFRTNTTNLIENSLTSTCNAGATMSRYLLVVDEPIQPITHGNLEEG